jgi:hypothetical protein
MLCFSVEEGDSTGTDELGPGVRAKILIISKNLDRKRLIKGIGEEILLFTAYQSHQYLIVLGSTPSRANRQSPNSSVFWEGAPDLGFGIVPYSDNEQSMTPQCDMLISCS